MTNNKKSVLFIEGFSPRNNNNKNNSTSYFEQRFTSAVKHKLAYTSIEAVRVVANTDLALGYGALEEYYGCDQDDGDIDVPRLIGIGSCIQKLESGLFHAVVVVNACDDGSYRNGSSNNNTCNNNDNNQGSVNLNESNVSLMSSNSLADYSEHPFMSGVLGSAVEAFVRHGGIAVFCAEESSQMLIGSLQYLFRVSWSGHCPSSDHHHQLSMSTSPSVWLPCNENAERLVESFGALVRPCQINADQASLDYESVSPSERCFVKAVSPDGNDCNKNSAEMSGVCIAIHDYSNKGGAIAYFGDSECGDDMMDLVAAFIMMRAPNEPIKSEKVEMTEADFAELSKLKRLGNEAFRAGNYQAAVDLYLDALCFFDTYSVKFNPHFVEEHLRLHALLSLCYIRMELWFDAQTCAENVLSFNPNHEESILRLATAAVGLVRSEKAVTKEWKISTLTEAKNNLALLDSSLNPAVSNEAAELSQKVQDMLSELTL